MNAALDQQLATLTSDEATLESALAGCGWTQVDSRHWRLRTEKGYCRLDELANRGGWRQLQLSSRATHQLDSSRVFEDNFRLFGPAKLVARRGDSPICRIDVPGELDACYGHTIDSRGQVQIVNAYALWASAITACATGDSAMSGTAVKVHSSLVNELKQAGWSVSLDDGQLQVHMQLPGIYRQIVVESDEYAGVKLATLLVDLARVDDDCIRAIKHFAHAINARLALVRLAISESHRGTALRAEIGFGPALIPGTFLLMSLHVMETASSLCVRELEALRDPRLARLLLAVAAARESYV